VDFLIDFIERWGFQGRIFMTPRFRGSWGVCNEIPSEVVFHLLVRGTCHVGLGRLKTKKYATMLPGDLVIFPRGDAHILFDHPDTKIMSPEELYSKAEFNPPKLNYGSKGPEAQFICGSFSLSSIGAELLLRSLPRQILIQSQDRSDPQMEQVVRMLTTEHLEKPLGHQLVISGLLKILFVCILRHTQNTMGESDQGLLKALEFPHLTLALTKMHTEFSKDWSLPKLAAVGRVSRAKFAKDFSAIVGQSPARYLNLVRMSESEQLLRKADLSIKQISHQVGFSSPEVFIRSFQRQFGSSPKEFRETCSK
jgi:AraC-like DNA-binding protein